MRSYFGVITVLLLFVGIASASHFRGAFYRWSRTPTPSAPYQVTFTVTSAWAGQHNISGSGSWSFSSPNDNVYLSFGDGVTSGAIQGSQILDSTDVTGEYVVVRQQVTHNYAAKAIYNATWNSFSPAANYGARKLFPNTAAIPGSPYGAAAILTTRVDLTSGYNSPIAQIPLVLELPISRPGFFATYALPIADPSGLEHTCRMATFVESGINYLANVSNAVSSGTIGVTSSCVITWDTSAGQVGQAWAVQVILQQSGSQTTIPLDFIVTLVNGSNTPTCVANTNQTVVITAGSNYTFFFTGTTPNTSYSVLRLDQLASDTGVFSPALAINGTVITSTYNVSFIATPAPSLTAEIMTLTITDGLGYQAYCSASFQGVPPHPAPYCNTSVSGVQYVQVGTSDTFSITAGSAASGVTYLQLSATGATYATIPNLGQNVSIPISSSVVVAPTAVGSETITFTFTDPENLVAVCPLSFVFIAPPVASFSYGGSTITTISIELGTSPTVTIIGTSSDTVTVTLTVAITGVPSWGSVTPLASYTPPAGIPLTLNPTTVSSGTVVTVTFTDSFGLTGTAQLIINVIANPPTCGSNPGTAVTVSEGNTTSFSITGATSDTVNTSLSISITGVPSWATDSTSGDTITFVLNPTAATSGTISVTFTDYVGQATTCSVSYTVIANPPSCSSSSGTSITVSEGDTTSFSITGSTTNSAHPTLTISITGVPSWATDSTSGDTVTFVLTPTSSTPGTISVTFTDTAGQATTCSVSYSAVANPPTCSYSSGTSVTVYEGNTTSFSITGSTTDSPQPTLTQSITGVPSWATDSTSGNTVTFVLNPNAATSGTINVNFTDPAGQSTTCSVSYTSIANPPSCSYSSGTSVSTAIGNTTSFSITGSTTNSAYPTLTISITGVPSWATDSTSGDTVSFTLSPTSISSGTINVKFTDTAGQATTCSVSYSVTEPGGCPPGFFFNGTGCQQQYLISAFGETPYGAMGVGATGNAVGSVPLPTVVEYLANQNVQKIQSGPRHSSIVTTVGNLYLAGLNGNGQLGINSTTNQDRFVQVTWFTENGLVIAQAFPGGYHTLVLTTTNVVYGFGLNSNGQLGQGSGSATQYLLPVVVNIPSGTPRGVATGFQHSLVWTDTQVYAFGSGDHGQSGAYTNVYSPNLVYTTSSGVTITMGTCGGYSSAFVTSNSNAYGYGGNIYGTLGIGSYSNTDKATLVSTLAGQVAFVSQAEKHAIFQATSGKLYATGNNACGNLGLGNFVNEDVPTHIPFFDSYTVNGICTGWTHSLVWTHTNLWVFGCDDEFNLGIPQVGTSPFPINSPVPNNFYNVSNVVLGADCKGHYSVLFSQLFI